MSKEFNPINKKIDAIRKFLNSNDLSINKENVRDILPKIMELKKTIGNLNMDIHFLASYLANSFLYEKHGEGFDYRQPGGRAGLDIDETSFVGEIKTTVPYNENDFGANQKNSIIKDLDKLMSAPQPTKYFFVIDIKTEEYLKTKDWAKHYNKIKVHNLLQKGVV